MILAPMELSSQALACFLAVAEHGSYTKAAVSLGLSQPGVHQSVRKLEAQLRTKLVEQHGKRVVLTEHGRVAYQYSRRLRDEEADLIRYLRDDASLEQGQLRISGGTTAAEFVLPTVAVAFQRLYPGIEIRVHASGTNADVDNGVFDRSFDLAVHSDPTARDGLEKVPFLADTLVGIAPAGHRLVRLRRTVTPLDLEKEQFIHFGPHGDARGWVAPIQSLITDWFAAGGVEPISRLNVATLEGIKRAVRDGGGVAIVSSLVVEADDPRLSIFRLASPPERCFYFVSRSDGWESNVLRAFREFVTSLAWAHDDPRGFKAPRARRAITTGGTKG